MIRRLGLTILTFAFMVACLPAQDEPPPEDKVETKKKGAKLPPFKKLEKKEQEPIPMGGDDPERIKKAIERLHKNMDASEERLNKRDPGEETHKVQEEIIKDLDELIKQQNNSGGGGGGGGSASSNGGGGGQAGSSSKSSGSSKSGGRSQRGSKGSSHAKSNEQKKNGSGKDGTGQDKDKSDPMAKGGPGKDGKNGDGMGGNPNANDKKDNNTLADLFKDVWGHLPLSKRQEMDAYSKERFLPKYDEILRQYYRTISEQGRRRDGE